MRWRRALGAAATFVAFLPGAVHAQRGGTPSEGEPAASSPRQVAVAPFTNVSGAPGDDWIGAGITATVVADIGLHTFSLARSRSLDRSPRVGDKEPSAGPAARDPGPALARRQGAGWLVRGGYQRLGDQIRITARTIDVESGAVTETVKVDGNVDELFELQDQLVQALRKGLVGAGRRPSPSMVGPRRRARVRAGDTAPATAGRVLPPKNVTGGIVIGDVSPRSGSGGFAGTFGGQVTVRPTRTESPPEVDGRLDDAVWRDAARITEFVQREPVDGAPATEATDVFIAYDSANIYLAVHAHYEDPGIMRANRSDRDQARFGDDTFAVYFDTFLAQQRAYVFSVNGYGVQGDSIVGGRRGGGGGGGGGGGPGGGGGGVPRGDSSWDALFSSGGQLVDDGYTAELAIPFKSLRYPARGPDVPHTWGMQLVRRIRGKDETVVWSPVSRDIAGFLPQMGLLEGMTGLSTSRNLEVQPTFTTFRFGALNEETGQVVDGAPEPEGGVNFKYGVTSNLTADLTFNPDFSQIESDRPQVEVNQRFSLFYPELRPFFLEGAEIFQIQAPFTPVHTRTIVDPQFGGKLTGKTGRTTVGVLYANDEAAGAANDASSDLSLAQPAQTFVGRVRYDLYPESFIGAIFTEREHLDRSSQMLGVDSNFRVGNTHQLGLRAMGSRHRDESRLETEGYVLDGGLRKRGRNLSYSLDASVLSPDFRTDVGYVRRTDQRLVEGRVGYEWWPQHWIISWGPEVRYGRNYNFGDALQDENTRFEIEADFAKNVRYQFRVHRDTERYEGIDFDKRRLSMFGSVNTSRRISVGGGFNWGDEVYFDSANPFLGRENGLRMFTSLRPVSRFQTRIDLTTSRFTDPHGFFLPGINDGERRLDGEVFDVMILRALSTYQFTDRLLFRNIAEFNSHSEALGLNFLVTYRVNAGTALYVGYNDHYRQFEPLNEQVNITEMGYRQTNRAVFTKFQYLFRY